MMSSQPSLKGTYNSKVHSTEDMNKSAKDRLEEGPIKKRPLLHLNNRTVDGTSKSIKVKQENMYESSPAEFSDLEKQRKQNTAPVGKALDITPGLKHTLAQFHLSSQSSLGGPAAFSARNNQECMSPSIYLSHSSPTVQSGPLLIPPDSSTELTYSLLEGEYISCFMVGGEKRLCLPQVLNSVLRDFSLQQINTVCDELYIYCSRCNADQLHILKVLGILPINAPSCGLITLTDAQRLCNALLRPGFTLQNASKIAGEGVLAHHKDTESTFEVEHECLGRCQGFFFIQIYTQPEAACIQCAECQMMFSPQKFVMHSHKSPDKRTCHWGFESVKWRCYLQLAKKYYGTPKERWLKQLLDEIKEKFSIQQKEQFEKEDSFENFQLKRSRYEAFLPQEKLPESEPMKKKLCLEQCFLDVKQDPASVSLGNSSCYLYMCDKIVAPNVSLTSLLPSSQESTKLHGDNIEETKGHPLENLVKHHSSDTQNETSFFSECLENQADNGESVTESAGWPEHHTTSCSADQVKSEHGSKHGPIAVAMETDRSENAYLPFIKDITVEDDKDKIVVEILQMYTKQQERLSATLQRKMELQMDLDILRNARTTVLTELSVENSELQKELDSIQKEHARQMEEVREEQRELERRLEQLRRQSCSCFSFRDRGREKEYAAQIADLKKRLDHTEAEREELQEELQRERKAREMLERMITELKQQVCCSATDKQSDAKVTSMKLTDSAGESK
ncbi:SKI-like proto-oncogene b [Erpetoichthys calabaricus]|nr:SKI-like proto-oncogene b [Erpetoichthys calabaricus]